MRHGNWNEVNTRLYNECHINPYYKTFIRLKRERMVKIPIKYNHIHDTIEEHVQCKECAQRACDKTTEDMDKIQLLIDDIENRDVPAKEVLTRLDDIQREKREWDEEMYLGIDLSHVADWIALIIASTLFIAGIVLCVWIS